MKVFGILKLSALAFVVSLSSNGTRAAETFVSFESGDLLLNNGGKVGVYVDTRDQKGVSVAVGNLMADITKVCGAAVDNATAGEAGVLIGTIGHSEAIDNLVRKGVIDGKDLRGKTEKYVVQTVGEQLVIAGSDRRGTIYGVYELSSQIGVSPWYYWADTPILHHDDIYIKRGVYTDGEPAVRYRGLFLNDEAPCLTTWVKNTFSTNHGDHNFYAKVFELILRLKGNMLWPAMWGWAFYADDPLNSPTADEMGIIIGTSHHEPMARDHEEWTRAHGSLGAWDYSTNKTNLDRFFRYGVERTKGTEDIITIGMRGDGDEAMGEGTNTKLLLDIVRNQRKIISEVTGKPAGKTPQMWALYKEVQDYYDKGMRVPDDVLILLSDDNWGDVRRVPSPKELNRKGGWGLYYHVDYVGAPRNSKWIDATPNQNMWEQLTLAYDYGVNRMWMLNVGDLKPMEYPITLFIDMAWKPRAYTAATLMEHIRAFCAQQFGEANANEAARILNLACKYNGRITAELLNDTTYNVGTGEWAKVVADYTQLEADALNQYVALPDVYHDVYREIVLFPVQAMGNLYKMYYAQAMNHKLYGEGNPDANLWADKAEAAFRRDSTLCAAYNHGIAGGKWNGMMTQKHIGYTTWADNFPKDTMPTVHRLDVKGRGNVFTPKDGVIAIEAEHYFDKVDDDGTRWTVIPYFGRTLSGVALMPYTKPTNGASLTYAFNITPGEKGQSEVKVHVIVKSTLDFLNKGGLTYNVSIDGGAPVTVNFNSRLDERPGNIHSIYYPTVAERVVESVVTLPIGVGEVRKGTLRVTYTRGDGMDAEREEVINNTTGLHSLTISPNDPGIVFEKIVIDLGGYERSFLFGDESPRHQLALPAVE